MAGLDALNPNPVGDVMSRADPMAGQSNLVQQATNNLYSDVAVLNPQDAFAQMYLANVPSAAEMARLKASVAQQQQNQTQSRQGYLDTLQRQWSPQQETALNWQALGQMGAAMIADPINPWGAGTNAYMGQRGKNMEYLNNMQLKEAETKAAFGEKDYATALDQYKLMEDTRRNAMKEIGDLWDRQLTRQQASRAVLPADDFGTVMTMDKMTNQPAFGWSPGLGVTAKDREAASSAAQKAIEGKGGSPEYKQQLYNQVYADYLGQARENNRRQYLMNMDPTNPVQVQYYENTFSTKLNPREETSPGLKSPAKGKFKVQGDFSPEELQFIAQNAAEQPGGPTTPTSATVGEFPTTFGSFTDYKGVRKLPNGYNQEVLKNRLSYDEKALQKYDEGHQLAVDSALPAIENAELMEALLQDPNLPMGPQAEWIAKFGNFLGGMGIQAQVVDDAGKFNVANARVAAGTLVEQLKQRGIATQKDTELAMSTLANLKGTKESALFLTRLAKAAAASTLLKDEFISEFQNKNIDLEAKNPRLAAYEASNKFFYQVPVMAKTAKGIVFMNEFVNDYMRNVDGATKAKAIEAWRKNFGRK